MADLKDTLSSYDLLSKAGDPLQEQLRAFIEAVESRLDTADSSAAAAQSTADDAETSAASSGVSNIAYFRDEKASTNQGGGMTQGVWHSRTLNTEVFNNITGCSLSSDTITLAAGTYKVWARCPGLDVNSHKCRIYNSSDESTIIVGSNAWNSNSDSVSTDTIVQGVFTLAAEKDIKLQHICGSTNATNGFGSSGSFSVNEVYAEIWIEKISTS